MAKIRNGSSYLGEHLTQNDYYNENEKVVGHWVGELSKEWQIHQQEIGSDDPVFEKLRQGFAPDDSPLTQRKKDEESRTVFYDFTNSAPKSISIQAMLDPRIREAHEKANAVGFRELERFTARRVRMGGAAWSNENEITGKLVAAVFTHDASRELDPQLHTHHVVSNVTIGTDGKRYAIDTAEMWRAFKYAGKAYENELAKECLRLGYEIEEVRNKKTNEIESFRIKGVSKELEEKFSKRSLQRDEAIKEELSRRNSILSDWKKTSPSTPLRDYLIQKGERPWAYPDGKTLSRMEKDALVKLSRATKDEAGNRIKGSDHIQKDQTPSGKKASIESVREFQLSQLSPNEKSALEGLIKKSGQVSHENPISSLQKASGHCFERNSIQGGHEILSEALNQNLGRIDLDALKASISSQLYNLDPHKTNPALSCQWATKEGLAQERWAVDFVDKTKGRMPSMAKEVKPSERLGEDQKKAVLFVSSTKDQVVSIRGVAGAGKTTMLTDLDKHLQKAEKNLIYLAPTLDAVNTLKKEGFNNATTVSEYLLKCKEGKEPSSWRNSVVVVDEAGLQSTKQGVGILEIAQRNTNRVVFVGDIRQHSSVEAGDFLRLLEDHSKISACELTDIRRQQPKEYNQAVREMSCGNVDGGLERIDQLGWIHEEGKDYLQAAATEYLKDRSKEALVVSPTWAENHEITKHIREGLKQSGAISEEKKVWVSDSLNWTAAQKTNPKNYQPGQIVTFTSGKQQGISLEIQRVENGKIVLSNGQQMKPGSGAYDVGAKREITVGTGDKILLRTNDKKRGLTNGDIWKVSKTKGDQILIERNGKQVALPENFKSFTHGYTVTSHKSQGRTVDHVIVAAQKLDGKAAYVGCSRGRLSCSIYTPEKQALFKSSMNKGDRKLALDVLKEKPKTYMGRLKAWGKEMGQKIQTQFEKIRGIPKTFVQKQVHEISKPQQKIDPKIMENQKTISRSPVQQYVEEAKQKIRQKEPQQIRKEQSRGISL